MGRTSREYLKGVFRPMSFVLRKDGALDLKSFKSNIAAKSLVSSERLPRAL